MEGLDFNNILSGDNVDSLFSGPDDNTQETEEKEETSPTEEPKEKENNTAEVEDPNDLFEEGNEETKPESVGSDEEKESKEKEEPSADTNSGASSNQNFYSSIANACAVDGIFPNLNEEDIKKATDAEGFSDLIEAEVNARLDDKQKRISKALENGVEPTDIKKYENVIGYINSITDAQISEEGDKGEQLRRSIIYQDFINKGYSAAKAQKLTERTIDAGTDIEDAKEALQSNKEYFSDAYNNLLKEAEDKANAEKAERSKQAEKLKTSIMNDKDLMGDIELSKDIRRKAIDSITKPVYRDPETGEYYTALQRYEMEHRADFLKNVGLMFTLTNGFKDFNSFAKGKVKKEMKKGLRELEQTLNNTRGSGGNLNMVTNHDENDTLFKGMRLDF